VIVVQSGVCWNERAVGGKGRFGGVCAGVKARVCLYDDPFFFLRFFFRERMMTIGSVMHVNESQWVRKRRYVNSQLVTPLLTIPRVDGPAMTGGNDL